MKVIKELVEYITEELCDAQKYIKAAMKQKGTDDKLSKMYYDLSKAQLEHAMMEHEQAARIIREYNQQAPASMRAIWDWQHQKMIDHKARIVALQQACK